MSILLESIGLEASKSNPCPLCDHDHYCYLLQNEQEIVKVVCQWTEHPPLGWERTGTAKDGRGIFSKPGQRLRRRNFPDYIQLQPLPKENIPEWQDHLLDMSGNPMPLQRDGRGQEEAIEYLYPTTEGFPLGKVLRVQWTDRRRVYENNRKTKQIRPWHWVGSIGNGQLEEGFWSDRGKGDKPWPLYRETEAKDEILNGGIVFVVAGEQAVETYRQMGLTATTCQGGEANYRQFVERLQDTFDLARDAGLKPMLCIHPDHDLTGESKFGDLLLKECDFAKIPVVYLDPLSLWPLLPPGGDIKDVVDQAGLTQDSLIQLLEAQIEMAIDRQEDEIRARKQRERWKAPEAWQGELGYWRETDDYGRYFHPKTDFDFQIERELASEDDGGLMLQLKRTDDTNQRRVFIKATDYTTAQKFVDALKRALGSSIVCNLSTYEVNALIRARLHEYHVTRQGKVYRLINRIGQQEDGSWVFKDCQFAKGGEPTDESQSLWVYNSQLTGEESTIPSPAIAGEDGQALKQLVDVMRRAFGSNIYPALLTLGYAAAGVHYQEILEREGAFPTLNLFGDPGSGKTTAAECALSLVGMHQDGMMCDISLSAAYERLKLSGSLLHCLDDPTRTPELNAFLKGFYNGKARVVRGRDVSFNVQKPHSPLMVTSNHACGENDAATQSRLIRLWFARANDGERQAFYELPAVLKQASGCLTQLIKLGYPDSEVHALEQELLPHLPYAHIRVAKSLALILCYAQKVTTMAEASEDLMNYVVNHICTAVNDPDEAGDSLRDFLEKVFALQSQSKLGDWNMRLVQEQYVDKANPYVLALHLPSVWPVVDREFKLGYNRKVIESLIVEAGGTTVGRQKFHRSQDESLAYYRAQLTPRYDATGELIPPTPPEWVIRRCIEIPHEILQSCSEKNMFTVSTGGEEAAEPPTPPESEPLTYTCQQYVNNNKTMSTDRMGGEPSQLGGEGEAQLDLSSLTKKTCQRTPLVDIKMSTAKSPTPQGLDPSQDPPVDIVDTKNTSILEGSDLVDPPPKLGDLVVVLGIAKWIRQGSDKLPYQEVHKSLRQAAEISINTLANRLFDELQEGGRILSTSADGQRVKVRNQNTGRTSILYTRDVRVLAQANQQIGGTSNEAQS